MVARKTKIIFLHGYLILAGAEELRRTVLKYFDKAKYDVTVCSLSTKGIMGEQMEKEGIRVVALGRSQEIWNPKTYFTLYKFLKKEKPDILQCCMFNAYTIGTVAGTLAGVRNIIWEEHNPEVYKKWFHIIIDKILSRRAAVIITCSKFVKDYMSKREGIPSDKFVPVLNCIDPEKFNIGLTKTQARKRLGLPIKAKIVIIVGRLHEQKGHSTLLRVWERLSSEINNHLLLVVGEGELKQELENFVRIRKMQNHVRFLGTRVDAPLLIRASDVLVLPSLYEGFGIVLLEAMRLGTPVVASNVGGIPEIVRNNWNGMLCEPEDEQGFYSCIKELFNSQKLSQKLASNSKRFVGKNFHPKRYIQDLEAIYKRLC